jgi:FlaA1/EpsC-like NDP-sugar epimerase
MATSHSNAFSDRRRGLSSMLPGLTEAILGREPEIDYSPAALSTLSGKRIVVTGAAGSIGSELVAQLHHLPGTTVFLLDHDESRMHALQLKLSGSGLLMTDEVVLADIRDENRIRRVIGDLKPDVIFHAAAHKHVPLLERYPCEAVKTNALGTRNLVDAAVLHDVGRFILVSTDKAASPTSMLGASKRLAETIVHANAVGPTKFASVRFGNVLGSRGSFLDTLTWQMQAGLPVTVTHRDVTRFFMTIPEAVGLVIEASSMASHGETYILDMGEPVKIVDVVKRYAELSGRPQPMIEYTGLRAGEKLHEILSAPTEELFNTSNARIQYVEPQPLPMALNARLNDLIDDAYNERDERVKERLQALVAESPTAVPALR